MSTVVFPRAGDSVPIKMREYKDKTQRKKRICVIVMGVIVVITTVLVILGLTVFKARDPKVQINTISLETFSIWENDLNMSMVLDVTVHNPNRERFQHSECVTRLFYYGDPVGQAITLAGNIRSKANECFSVRLKVEASHPVLVDENLPRNIVSGRLPMVATTTVAGVVKVLGVFKHHAVTTSHCDVSIFVANATIQSFFCRHGMKV